MSKKYTVNIGGTKTDPIIILTPNWDEEPIVLQNKDTLELRNQYGQPLIIEKSEEKHG